MIHFNVAEKLLDKNYIIPRLPEGIHYLTWVTFVLQKFNPDIEKKDLSEKLDCSVRTVYRYIIKVKESEKALEDFLSIIKENVESKEIEEKIGNEIKNASILLPSKEISVPKVESKVNNFFDLVVKFIKDIFR